MIKIKILMNRGLYYPISLFLKITDFCPNNCMDGRYCFANCSPDSTTWIDKERMRDIFAQAKEEGLRELIFASTEPVSNLGLLADIIGISRNTGIMPRFLGTNGRIGSSYVHVRDCFKKIQDAGFDFSVDERYLGCGLNGIDVSVDQFHGVPPEWCANTVLAALDVFGPTIFVSMRNVVPSYEMHDPYALNTTARFLFESGRVERIDKKSREIVFYDGSRVKVHRERVQKIGRAKTLPDNYFYWHDFSLREIRGFQDLSEFSPYPVVSPFHRLYINPDGRCYPELGRFGTLGGGSVYDLSVKEVIRNIDSNPLVALLIGGGFETLLSILRNRFNINLNLHASGVAELYNRYLSERDMMQAVKEYVKSSGLDKIIRDTYIPLFEKLRSMHDDGNLKIVFEGRGLI